MITERKRAPRRTHMTCEKCGKDVLLENLDILMMGGMPERVWHNECLKILKHNDQCLDTCSCKRKKKMVYDRTHNEYDQKNGHKSTPDYRDSLVVTMVATDRSVVGEISVLPEAKSELEKESTASEEGGGTTTQIDPKASRIASGGHLCINCGNPIVMTGKRGRPAIRCGNCKSGVTRE